MLSVAECVSLEALEADPQAGRIDPIRLLGLRYAAIEDAALAKAVANGARIPADCITLLERCERGNGDPMDSPCTPYVMASVEPLSEGELVALLNQNKLVALYAYDGGSNTLKSRCGFAQGVSRGIV
jgi:tRNA pseudouridine55 synthase